MRFQMKLLVAYSVFIIFIVIIMGGVFYKYNTKVFESSAYSNIAVISDKMSQQLDNLVHPMDFKTTELLSDQSVLSSLTTLANADRNDISNLVYFNEARETIYSKLMTYSIDKNFYRVSIFNNKGDFLSSNFRTTEITGDLTNVIKGIPWKKTADEAVGKLTLIPPHTDPWTYKGNKIFSVVRSVQWPSSGMGYVEIQENYSELEKIFKVPDKLNTKVVAITNDGENFFKDDIQDNSLLNYYTSLATSSNGILGTKKNLITGKEEVITSIASDYTGIKIIIAQDKDTLFKPLLVTARTTFIVGFIVIGVSFIYIYVLSEKLTKPIRQLKEKIENTELDNLPDKILFERSHNEFESLNNSFKRLRERLNEAVSREMRSQSLQISARLDSLQAQINPHFIYNVLNVLSNKGIESGDEEICEICDGIAAMLRYSTSTLKTSAVLGEEIEHVRNYLILMKKRFEHRLEYEFNLDDSIFEQVIPKIVLQPIVENAVNHGFEAGLKVVKIDIKGYVKEGCWYIEISDNGSGFSKEVLSELEQKIEREKEEVIKGDTNTGFAIGGMGLINTVIRLLLFYNNDFIFKLENSEAGGAQVTIGSKIVTFKEEIE